MDYASYLRAVGLPEYADASAEPARRGGKLVARPPHATVAAETVEDRYVHPIPEEGAQRVNGVGPVDDRYNLAPICGLEYDPERLRDHPNTARLVALHQTMEHLAEELNVDWIGVYRHATTPGGAPVLVKEAYVGADSRAEFPLTDEFAARSNVSSVGRTGNAALVNDLAAYDGPYYECDERVQSEFCCPVLAGEDVLGVVDAEAHDSGFFTEERVLTIAGACAGLADSDLLTPPRVDN